VLYHWKKQYSRASSTTTHREGALKGRIEKLERFGGEAHLENEFLKRGLQHKSQPVLRKREIVGSLQHIIRYIHRGCGLMKLARSSFYYKPKSRSPERMKAETDRETN